ncbi:DDHD domain-containing protein [Blakeslea trispora]|nr:DDHD domain-containing protein [Blakeslea trispora]
MYCINRDTTGGKIARSFFTTITNNQNLGGIKLLRGHQEVKNESKKNKEENNVDQKSLKEDTTSDNKVQSDHTDQTRDISTDRQKLTEQNEYTKRLAEDYENEKSEEEMREIDQVVLVIHGIGQQMSERMGQNFVHDVNVFRKTIKSTWPIAISGTGSLNRANGIQVLPILWRNSIVFGVQDNEETEDESDLGIISDGDDGCPTIDEITLEGAPNIRTLVSDVFLDIPLYLTSKYHDLMIQVVTKEVNRVYQLFIKRNPSFQKNNGQVSIMAHSLGSLIAFDILTSQPFSQTQKSASPLNSDTKKLASLSFPVKNFFAIGSPLGMILLLKGNKIVSRKSSESTPLLGDSKNTVTFVYPAVDSVYNIFHKSDPVAYRLEPLVVRHYGSRLKPVPIPYIKGGLKSVLDASFHMGNDLANKANSMIESLKSGLTNSLLMRGFGFSFNAANKESVDEELTSRSESEPSTIESKAAVKSAAKLEKLNPHHGRLDFYLQEGLLENAYISAISVHMSYWQDIDIAGFLIREIYRDSKHQEIKIKQP